jgi:hypothetical protein
VLAAYFFRFYAIDQSIEVGKKGIFHFFRDPYWPRSLQISSVPEYATLVFQNVIDPEIPSIDLECTILQIKHPDLGAVQKIQISSGEYRIETEKGEIFIDPEENIGDITGSEITVSGWLFFVEIEVHGVA